MHAEHFRGRRKNCEKRLLDSRLSLRLSVWSNTALTRQISMKFDILVFLENLPRQVTMKSHKNNGYLTWRSIYRVIRNDCRGFNHLPTRSLDATPCDFFPWGYVKYQIHVRPLPASVPEMKVRIRTAVETITTDMLQTVWNELNCRVNVCRITKGAYIEQL